MKYSPAELRKMARVALAARAAKSTKWGELLARLESQTGVPPRQAEQLIEMLAGRR